MNSNNTSKLIFLLIFLLLASACQRKADLANPASVYCIENDGTLELRTDEAGGQVGYCLFEDGSECEEWAFFRGDCQPGDSLRPQGTMANPASVYCEENDGILEIRTLETGGQVGYCLFEDGSECEEWDFYRGDCLPGDQ